jgi:hypothetical protein
MGQSTAFSCTACGGDFAVRVGGGFFFDLLHCDRCGASKSVGHRELGEIHLRFVKGLGAPYAVARASIDRDIRENYPGEPITRDEYHALAEATLDPCPCGGRFLYAAPPRCPFCRSTREAWSNGRVEMHYD